MAQQNPSQLHTLDELRETYHLTDEEARGGCQLQARVRLVLQKLIAERAAMLSATNGERVDIPDVVRIAVAQYVGYDLHSEERPEDALKLTTAEKIAFAAANAERIKAARKAANDKIKADQLEWILAQRAAKK